jgi:hypothetical protein
MAFRSLSEPADKELALKLIDDCHLQEGELSQALELLYRNDDKGMREELRRRGIKNQK